MKKNRIYLILIIFILASSGINTVSAITDHTLHYKSQTSDIDHDKGLRISVHLPTTNQWIKIYEEYNTRNNYEFENTLNYPESADKIRVEFWSTGVGNPDWLYKNKIHNCTVEKDLPGWGSNVDLEVLCWTKWKSGIEFNKCGINID